MKRKVLSMLICTSMVVSQVSIIPTIVNADTIVESSTGNINDDIANSTISAEVSVSSTTTSAVEVIREDISPNIIVDNQYTGDNGKEVDGIVTYSTVGAAIASIDASNTEEKIIFIKKGIYKEKLTITTPYITLVGESAERTILTYDDASGVIVRTEDGGDGTKTYGTGGSASVRVTAAATNFKVANLTMSNSFDESANSTMKNKQAIALYNDADESVFVNCKLLGNQDTLCAYTNRQYYYKCYIEGDVDFIFGAAQAVFEKCEIHSLNRPGITPKGYITAPSTLSTEKYGFLILNSNLTSDEDMDDQVYLGRPWQPNYPLNNCKVLYKNCKLGSHITSDGWYSMSNTDKATNTSFTAYPKDNSMYEYNNYGPGKNTTNTNRKQLSDEDAANYTLGNVLKGWDSATVANKLSSYIEGKNDCDTTTNTIIEVKNEWNKNDDGTWSFINSDGQKVTGWLKDTKGVWYYLNDNGVMKTGWFKDVNEKWYYLNASGDMAVNTTIDGYEVDNTGDCIY